MGRNGSIVIKSMTFALLTNVIIASNNSGQLCFLMKQIHFVLYGSIHKVA